MLEVQTNATAGRAPYNSSLCRGATPEPKAERPASTGCWELFHTTLVGAQHEVNRLCNIARKAGYEVRFFDPKGAIVDLPGSGANHVDDDRRAVLEDRRPVAGATATSKVRCGRQTGIHVVNVGAAPSDFSSHFRVRHGGISNAAAPIFDAAGELVGTLDIVPFDTSDHSAPAPLTRALVQSTARAIEERIFRERHRNSWIVAVSPRDPAAAPKLFAVDGQQSIRAADRHAREMMGNDLLKEVPSKAISLWALFERNSAAFLTHRRGDVTTLLVPIGVSENWSAVITPPEAVRPNSDGDLHVRPRIDVLPSFPQVSAVEQARGGLAPGVLRRVLSHIDANLDADLGVTELSSIANLSRWHFVRSFRQSVGLTPHRYLVSRRVERAMELLSATEMPLAEIALSTGFSDQSHFSRRFREHAHTPPSAFRRAKR